MAEYPMPVRPWLPMSAMPIGDHRNVVVEVKCGDDKIVFAYWTGQYWAAAPVVDQAPKLLSAPKAFRHLPRDIVTALTPHLTAGAYLRKRREATGLTIDQAARWATGHSNEAYQFRSRLIAFEADIDVAGTHTLHQLRTAFSFDVDVYQLLAEGCPPGVQLCRSCACSWKDPCPGECRWFVTDLCSKCAVGLIPRPPATASGASTPVLTPDQAFTLLATDPYAPSVLTILGLLHARRPREAQETLTEIITNRMARLPDGDQAAADLALEAADRMNIWRMSQRTASIEEPVHV